MIRNYLKAALLNVLKNKIFSAINVLGLAIGMAGCLLITQYVLHELSYDQMQSFKGRIFRLQLDRYNKGEVTTRWAAGAVGMVDSTVGAGWADAPLLAAGTRRYWAMKSSVAWYATPSDTWCGGDFIR